MRVVNIHRKLELLLLYHFLLCFMHRRRQGWWFLEAMTTAQADQYPEIRKGSNHIQWVVVFVEKWLYWWPIIIFFLCFNGCSHSSFRTQESFVRCIWCVKTRFCSGGEIPWGFLLDALTPYWVLLAPLFIIKLITRTYMALRYELSIIHALIGLAYIHSKWNMKKTWAALFFLSPILELKLSFVLDNFPCMGPKLGMKKFFNRNFGWWHAIQTN